MKKQFYEIPLTVTLEIRTGGTMLTGSVETMRSVTGSWEEEDDELGS